MVLALTGFALVLSFMTLIMTRRLSAITALVIVPVIFALAIGSGAEAGEYVMGGIKQVAPTAVMLVFALLYFLIMYEAGLFEPFIAWILKVVGEDPVRIVIGDGM